MRAPALLLLALTGCGAEHLVGRVPPACSGGATSGFRARETERVTNPDAVAADYLNGDRVLDLVVANSQRATVTPLLGEGDGAFSGAPGDGADDRRSFQAGPGRGFFSLALGDVDRDGHIDLLVANDAGLLLRGQGDGTFVEGPAWAAAATAVIVADLDGDSLLDLAALDRGGDTLSVLLGVGDGTFREAVVYPTAAGPQALLAADLDGDDKPDLAITNRTVRSVSVFLGVKLRDGTWTLGSRADYDVGEQPDAVAAADLDGDGRRDLVTTVWSASAAGPGGLRVLRGVGGGLFQRASGADPGGALGTPVALALDDLDGDGQTDAAVADLSGNTVTLLYGQGGGRLGAATTLAAGCSPSSLLIADVDRDGRRDVVVTSWYDQKVRVLLRSP